MTDAVQTNEEKQPPAAGSRRAKLAVVALLALVALGDWLLFWHPGGFGLFAFAMAVMLAVAAANAGRAPARQTTLAVMACFILAAPLLEAPTLSAVLMAMLGLAVLALTTSHLLPERWIALPEALARFGLLAPARLAGDAIRAFEHVNIARLPRRLVVWILPVALLAVFVGLFWSANAVIADVLDRIGSSLFTFQVDPFRLVGWIILAIVCWPVLRPRLPPSWRWAVPATKPNPPSTAASLLFGPAAILRALLLFNAIFAVETLLDLAYLWGGATLPDGLTYADYAHRGAYPLVCTALLAAVFVLAAMRPGGAAQQSPLIRGLVYAWIAQNILLCISAVRRLELYVEAYSLTELRVASGIWMLLVAAGLGLILLRIRLGRSNEWLVATNLATLTLTVYACSFIDIKAAVAEFNVDHSQRLGGQVPLDIGYFRELGPTSIPALDRYIAALAQNTTDDDAAREMRATLADHFATRDPDWRSWSYRGWRLSQYLAEQPTLPTLPER